MKELLEEEAKDRNFKERELDSIKNYENSKFKSSLKHCIKYPKFLNNTAECFTLKFEKNENLLAAGNYLLCKIKVMPMDTLLYLITRAPMGIL
jgi:hypothetical protein